MTASGKGKGDEKKPEVRIEDLTIPQVWEGLKLFGDLHCPDDCEEPILGSELRAALLQWLYELNHETALKAVGVKARTRALFSGPPGTGKTTLARHVCARIGINMLVVKADAILSKWVNGSGEQIGLLFKLAKRVDVALFFDELDAAGSSRSGGDTGGGAENNKVVIALLQHLDTCENLIFGATNRADVIDPAIWRRFQVHMTVGLPGQVERFAIVKRYMAPLMAHDRTIVAISDALEGASPSLIKDVLEGVRRDHVIGPKLGHDMDITSVFTRLAAAVRPSPEFPQVPLWFSPELAFGLLEGHPWPPVLSKKAD